MEVWRIKQHERNYYAYGIFGTRTQAAYGMVRKVRELFKRRNLSYSKMWVNMKPDEIVKLGEYRQKEYGLFWTIERCQFQDKKKWQKNIEPEEEVSETWCNDLETLEGDMDYDIEISDGTVTSAIFDEQYGYFRQEDGNEIDMNEVLKFKRR